VSLVVHRRLNSLGTASDSGGDLDGAEDAFRKAIAADPTYASAHYGLSVVPRQARRLADADIELRTQLQAVQGP
jgi:Flp pilus assembly protein TadD